MKFRKLMLVILMLSLLLTCMTVLPSCGSSNDSPCADKFIDTDSDGICDKCGYGKIVCDEHTEVNVSGRCTVCNYSLLKKETHPGKLHGEFVDADGDGICDTCGSPEQPCTDHTPVDNTGRCTICKYSIIGCIRHEDIRHDDNVCDKCGAECTPWDEFTGRFMLFWNELANKGGYKVVLEGLKNTIFIAVVGLLIGIVIGIMIALIKVMPRNKLGIKILSGICDVYVGFFRGTPMMVQLLIGYFILLPMTGLMLEEEIVATAIFGFNSGAYVSEIMRAGIQSVDSGQLEAGRAVGLPFWTAMMKIVIPQSIKNILPTLGNEFIVLIKETSIVTFIGATDITKAIRGMADATYEYIVPYLVLAMIYLVLVIIITMGIKLLERRLRRNERSK